MTSIKSILIANRGEIACRIIKTCKKMGIQSIAVYSDADQDALHVKQADVAVHIGASAATASYLNQDTIIQAAKRTQASAIHPGYGFLSENAAFAQRCADEDVIFIGPQPKAIALMGSKSQAKTLMKQQGVPVIEGYQGEDQRESRLIQEAEKLDFPILLKATAGGGGKGMRIVNDPTDLANAIEAAKREALSSFGDDELIIERYFPEVRHIEFQVFGDQQGNVVHLFERECSLQRRHQKVMEESPSPALTPDLREQMATAAIQAAKALDYHNAGTVEFILTPEQEFFFLEVNTRLQVEHPVTEAITGLDLVEWQIRIAEGQPLPLRQDQIKMKGYAVESRLYAEDVSNNFLPVTGKVLTWDFPQMEGIRVDTGIENGSEISIYYDPMVAKIIAHAPSRAEAHRIKFNFLSKLACLGLTTNQTLLTYLFDNKEVNNGNYNTHFLASLSQKTDNNNRQQLNQAALALLIYRWKLRDDQRKLLPKLPSGWRNNRYQLQQESFVYQQEEIQVHYQKVGKQFHCQLGKEEYQVGFISLQDQRLRLSINGIQYTVAIAHEVEHYYLHSAQFGNYNLRLKARYPQKEIEKTAGAYLAPMPSEVLQVLVKTGEKVSAGTGLVILSSMKMENTICAEKEGMVQEVFVSEGEHVEAGKELVVVSDEC